MARVGSTKRDGRFKWSDEDRDFVMEMFYRDLQTGCKRKINEIAKDIYDKLKEQKNSEGKILSDGKDGSGAKDVSKDKGGKKNKKNKGFGGFVSVHSTRASFRWHSSLTRSSSESRRRKEGRLLLSNPHTNQADRPRVEEDGVSSQGDRHGIERADVYEQGGEERFLVCPEEHVQVAGNELSLLPQRVQPREDRHLQRRIHSQ